MAKTKASLLMKTAFDVPPAVWMILLMLLYFGLTTDNYLTINNVRNIIIQATPLFVAACGQTLVVLIQGTDLSMGASMNMVMVLWMLMMRAGTPMPLAMLASILAAVLAGFLNGVFSANLALPAFIATLGTQNILNAIALTASNGSTITFQHTVYKVIGNGSFLGIPYLLWIAVACFLATWLMLNKMKFGSRVRALGGNQEALVLAGYSANRATIQVFAFAGFMAGIAGIMLACRVASGNPNGGNGFEFNSVAAVLLGGTSMIEGRGGIVGTVFGVLLIQTLKYSLVVKNVASMYQTAIIGIVVLLALVLDVWLKRRQVQ